MINNAFTKITMGIAVLCWGLSFIAIKIALRSYSPIAVTSIRLFFVILIMGVIFLARNGFKNLPLGKHIPLFILVGILNPFLGFYLECTSMVTVSASLASVMLSTIPLFTPLAVYFLLGQKISLFNILGLLISFVGIFLLIFGGGAETEYTVRGLFLLGGSVLAGVLYTVFAKKLLNIYPPLTVVTFQQIFGFILYIPIFINSDAAFVFNTVNTSYEGLLSILFLAIFPSCIAYYFFNHGINRIGPSKANAFMNLTPVVAAIASFFFLGETLGFIKISGILIATLGLFLSQRGKRKNNKSAILTRATNTY